MIIKSFPTYRFEVGETLLNLRILTGFRWPN